MYDDMITVLRNELNSLIEQGGEDCLCNEPTVKKALELEEILRSYNNPSS